VFWAGKTFKKGEFGHRFFKKVSKIGDEMSQKETKMSKSWLKFHENCMKNDVKNGWKYPMGLVVFCKIKEDRRQKPELEF
jgi:hypothetical protein